MSVVSATSGAKTNISILKSFPLTLNQDSIRKPLGTRQASTVQPVARRISGNLQLGAGVIASPPVPTKLSTPSIDKPVPDFPEFKEWAQDAIHRQQRDIDRVSATGSRIEGEMQQFRDFMREVRVELQEGQRLHQAHHMDREVLANLQVDMSNLDEKVDKIDNEHIRGKSGVSLNRDIEIIISDMLTVSNKANEVDDVKIGLQQVTRQIESIKQLATNNRAVHGSENLQGGREASDIDGLRNELRQLRSQLDLVQCIVNGPLPQPIQANLLNTSPHYTDTASENKSRNRLIPRVEIPVQAVEHPAQLQLRPGTSAGQPSSCVPILEYYDDDQAPSRKRKYDQAKSPPITINQESGLHPALLVKRRKGPPRKVKHAPSTTADQPSRDSRGQIQTPKPDVIDIISSENGGSPILSRYEEPGKSNMARNTGNSDQPFPAEYGPENAITSNTIIVDSGPKGVVSVHQTASTNNSTASTPGSLDKDCTIKSTKLRRQSDISHAWNPDSHAIIETLGGQTRRRSLRSHKQSELTTAAIGDNKNLEVSQGKIREGNTGLTTTQDASRTTQQASTFPQSSNKQLQSKPGSRSHQARRVEASSAANETQKENPSRDVISSSIERDEQPFESGSIPLPSASYPTPNPHAQDSMQPVKSSDTKTGNAAQDKKPYKCPLCPRRYSSIPGLLQHKSISACQNQVTAEDAEDVNKAQLLARREKLVTEMLEREMMTGI
ncbi:uncharacterized protein BP5553_02932 [Venustampulla echinocandica]|uniref:C2H2-type domain-containing protein n=1 Tax=Venustampulla echinocandica TaxID=2656787 RepID=A0A370TST4_9HELO|nr:uncharacterized protein BP5553_02932 [Venustampulla echinocandica]RDL38592.1 hypothetical protein BP5553_02932 [Venustampulla echinocandica]